MDRPGTEAFVKAGAVVEQAEAELAPLIGMIAFAWESTDPDKLNLKADEAKGTIRAVIAKLEQAEHLVEEMKGQILGYVVH
jgi:hypothetical protein